MKHFITVLLLCTLALAQDIPTQNPSEVVIKGRFVNHIWRDGRVFVSAAELGPLLNIESKSGTLDLIQALEAKGGYLYKMVDGRFEATRDPSQYSQSTDTRKARMQNRRQGANLARQQERKKQQEALQPNLTHQVQKFVSETGFVRAFIRVTNEGASASPAVKIVVEFTDGYGKAFAQDESLLAPLQPGEHQDVEAFSMIRNEELAANGVIRTVNNEKVRVTFHKI